MDPSQTSLEAEVSMEKAAVEIPEVPPFHILVLGDFSGGGSNSSSLKPLQIDRDDFENVMRLIGPSIKLEAGETGTIGLRFGNMDDFHPDTLFRNVSLFDRLRAIREELLDEDSFNSAAREVRGWFTAENDDEEHKKDVSQEEVEGADGLLEDILGSRTRDAAAYKEKQSSDLKAFVKKVVDPFIVAVDENEQARLLAAVDEATGQLMKSVLGDRAFRSLESLWRGLYLMCRRIETSKDLKIFVADITKERFIEELKSETSTGLSELLLGRSDSTGTEPWALIAGAYDFDLNVDDVAALMRIGGAANLTGAAFVSHIRPRMLGIRSFADEPDSSKWDTESDSPEGKLWTVLRGSPDAESIGLVTPRLLARLPYGESTEPTEVFSFEEVIGDLDHDDYLWMNPVFGFAVIMAASFSKHGWEIGGRYELDLTGLPVHVYKSEGNTVTKPCAEIEMTDSTMEVLLDEGLMPFASFKNTDRVRLVGVQSVKFPQRALKGRWS